MVYNTLISTQDLSRHLNDPAWVVVDCRFNLGKPQAGEEAYRAGHIPEACYAHLDRDLSSPVTAASGRHPLPDPAALARTLGRWGVDGTKQVVVYDDVAGPFAARLWWLLRWLGHPAVAVLDGGLNKWRAEDRPLTAALPDVRPAVFDPRSDDGAWVSSAFVMDHLARGDYTVVDARAAERFAGEVEPLDTVAGHVPGAVNRPFTGNLDGAGCLLPASDLRRAFQGLVHGVPPARVIHMCGSGVTACHNLLAMEAAGLMGSKLYAGSWSEWIRDGRRPVASGR
jgi:thiosulfate/3-mercaptopyruvate sulfurtransferase